MAAGANVMTWASVAYWLPLAGFLGGLVAIWWIERRMGELHQRSRCIEAQRQAIEERIASMDERARDFSRAIGYARIGMREEAVGLLKRWEAPEDAR